jgi:hypothetical protein
MRLLGLISKYRLKKSRWISKDPDRLMTKESGLTPKLLEVAQMFASGLTYSQISEAVNAPRSTVGRWAKLESVQAQVSILKNEAQQACREVSREAATEVAQNLQDKLSLGIKRQEALIARGYSLALGYLDLTQKMLGKATEIFTSDRPIESHEKILVNSVPSYLRAASDVMRSVSDAEDKIFAVQEISKRLDEWQMHWSETERN